MSYARRPQGNMIGRCNNKYQTHPEYVCFAVRRHRVTRSLYISKVRGWTPQKFHIPTIVPRLDRTPRACMWRLSRSSADPTFLPVLSLTTPSARKCNFDLVHEEVLCSALSEEGWKESLKHIHDVLSTSTRYLVQAKPISSLNSRL
jgi:hypothetical protein